MARKKESTWPAPTPERQLESPSGWCITSDHDTCKYQFDHGKCGCICHTEIKTEKIQNKFNKLEGNDPRPWKEK